MCPIAAGPEALITDESLLAAQKLLRASKNGSTASISNGGEPERLLGEPACSTSAAEAKAAPAAGGTAAPADPTAAQLPKPGVAGAHAAARGGRQRSRERPAKAAGQAPPQLTWAQVQRSLDTGRLDRAAAALAAAQEEAEQAGAVSHWMHVYLVSAQAWLAACRPGAVAQADLVARPAIKGCPAQQTMLANLLWAVGKTRARLEGLRDGWEARLQAIFGWQDALEGRLHARVRGHDKKVQPHEPEAREAVDKYADTIAGMLGCYEAMQERLAGFVRAAAAEQHFLAAATYALIRSVRCTASQAIKCAKSRVACATRCVLCLPQEL